jgi:hypothetical protein
VKICSGCKIGKNEAEFNKKYNGLQPWCRECNRARSRRYYAENKDLHKKNVRETNKKPIARNQRHILDYLGRNPCVDCGEPDVIVLEFDHVRGEKTANVGRLIQDAYSLRKLKDEIEKCEVVCANCHRRRTYARLDSCYKIGVVPGTG